MEVHDIGKALQELARHEMIELLYKDILADMAVCDIEGWDKMEYIRQLREKLNSLGYENEEIMAKGHR